MKKKKTLTISNVPALKDLTTHVCTEAKFPSFPHTPAQQDSGDLFPEKT